MAALLVRDGTATLLKIEQELFTPQTATVTAELTVAIDDAVAGNDDGNAVGAVGGPDRSLCARTFYIAGDLFV